METMSQREYDQISIREFIEALLNGWKIIAIITIICVLSSAIFSFFIIKPRYEAKTTLMASLATDRLSSKELQSEDLKSVLDSLSSYSPMTIQTYKEQIKNPQILLETIDDLELEDKGINIDSLSNMISLETIKDTNLIILKVNYIDPELATSIANTVAEKFTAFVTDIARQQASKTSEIINSQLKEEEVKLDKGLIELKEFLSQPRGVEELRLEMESKLEELNSYKDRLSREEINFKDKLLDKEMEEKSILSEIESAREQLEDIPKKFTTMKSILDDSATSDIVQERKGSSSKDIYEMSIESEEINPTYIELTRTIAQYKIDVDRVKQEKDNIKYVNEMVIKNLEDKIADVKKEVEELKVELAEKEYKEKLVQSKVNLNQSTYEAFLNKYETARIAESTEIGESSITIVSQSMIPKSPISPNKKLNLAISAVFGLLIGMFIVFFKQYWKTSGKA